MYMNSISYSYVTHCWDIWSVEDYGTSMCMKEWSKQDVLIIKLNSNVLTLWGLPLNNYAFNYSSGRMIATLDEHILFLKLPKWVQIFFSYFTVTRNISTTLSDETGEREPHMNYKWNTKWCNTLLDPLTDNIIMGSTLFSTSQKILNFSETTCYLRANKSATKSPILQHKNRFPKRISELLVCFCRYIRSKRHPITSKEESTVVVTGKVMRVPQQTNYATKHITYERGS